MARTSKRLNEPIDVQRKRFGYFPQTFLWRGQRHEVSAVERCWTISRRRGGRKTSHLCFQVRCPEGRFILYQDLLGNTWHIERRLD